MRRAQPSDSPEEQTQEREALVTFVGPWMPVYMALCIGASFLPFFIVVEELGGRKSLTGMCVDLPAGWRE